MIAGPDCPSLTQLSNRATPASISQIGHQAHKALVLVILMMAMEQCGPRMVGDEVNLDGAESRHIDRILDDAGSSLFTYFCDLKAVAMHVDGMVVTTLVGHRQAIAFSGLGGEQRIGIRPGFSVDRPTIVATTAARHFFKD